MKITFKLLKAKDKNEWLGWFGDDLIKVRLLDQSETGLIQFIKENLGINKEKLEVIKIQENFITLELPDVAWELLLSAIE